MTREKTSKRYTPILGIIYCSLLSCSSPLSELERNPEGPCWQVTLSDGFSSGDEFVDTFHCLNNSHNFDAFLPSVQQLYSEDRNQVPLKDNLAEIANQLFFTEENAPISIVHDFLDQHPVLTTDLLSIMRVVMYGKEAIETPFDQNLIDEGLVYPTISLTHILSNHLLDNTDQKDTLEHFLFSSNTQEGLCSFFGLMQNPNTQPFVFSLPQKLGQAFEATYDTSNDIWADAGDNSIIWFVNTLFSSSNNISPPIITLSPPIQNILSDTRIRTPLKDIVITQLKPELYPAIQYLIDVDRLGNPRTSNTPSAMYDIFSIMEQSNAPLECSLSIFSFSISEISIDNLAVDLLSRIANESPETVDTALSLLNVLHLGITDWMLDQIVASEVCPMLSYDFVSRFQALQRLNDPEVAPLLGIGLDIIKVLRHPTQSRLPDVADIMSTIQSTGLTMPMEEVLTDILHSELLVDGTNLIPYFENLHATCPNDIEPISYSAFLNLFSDLLSEEHRSNLSSLAAFVIEQDDTWNIYSRIPSIMQHSAMERLLPTAHNLDLYTIEIPNIDRETRNLIYRTMEHSDLSYSLMQYDPQMHTPLTWIGQILIDDTAHELISLIVWLDERLSILSEE